MGNVPSKELQGRASHKLSKPRTAAAPTAQPVATTPHDPSSDLISIPYSATANLSSVDEDQDDHSSKSSDSPRRPFVAPPKVQRRLSLFRSKSSQETSDRRKSRRNTIIGSPTLPSEDHGASRAQSLSADPLPSGSQNDLWAAEKYVSLTHETRASSPSTNTSIAGQPRAPVHLGHTICHPMKPSGS